MGVTLGDRSPISSGVEHTQMRKEQHGVHELSVQMPVSQRGPYKAKKALPRGGLVLFLRRPEEDVDHVAINIRVQSSTDL